MALRLSLRLFRRSLRVCEAGGARRLLNWTTYRFRRLPPRRHPNTLPMRGGPDGLRWFWLLTTGRMTHSGRVAALEEAKAQLQKSWDAWKAWAKLEETE